MLINLPEGQSLFIWDCGGESTTPIVAKDYDEALRKVIAHRISLLEGSDEDRLIEALLWFSKNDTLLEVNCNELMVTPYAGELPDEVFE